MVSIHIALEIIELVIGTCNYPNQADDKIYDVDQGKICGKTDERRIAASKSMNTDNVTPIVKNTRASTETNNEMDGVVSDNQVRSTELKESDISAKPKVRKHVASIHSTTNVNATLKDDGRATELKECDISAKPKVRKHVASIHSTTNVNATLKDDGRATELKESDISAKPKVRKHDLVDSIHNTTNVNATLKDNGRATELKECDINAKPKVRKLDLVASIHNTTSIISTVKDNGCATELKECNIDAKPKVRIHDMVALIQTPTNVNATLKDNGRAIELKESSISAKPKVRNNDSKQNTTSIIPTARDNDRVAAANSTNVNIVKPRVRSKAIGESTDILKINNPHSGINTSSVRNKHKVKYIVRDNNLTNDIYGMKHRKKRKRRRCRYCGEWNHNKYECRYESPLTCHICYKLGHKMKFCHEYP